MPAAPSLSLHHIKAWTSPALLFLLLPLSPVQAEQGDVSFTTKVQPILAEKCLACHGPDAKARKGDLRLDLREAAIESGAVKPGQPDESELIKRLVTKDPDEVMPPPGKQHEPVTAGELAILRQWIAEGAGYEQHWAYMPLQKRSMPVLSGLESPIDQILRARQQALGLVPAEEATREEWLRRVTLALTGLVPTTAELNAFLKDDSPTAFEKVVDRLLQSPHYGERLAVDWLDAARYGDTYGRHEDADSPVWPWREWVIKAFNDNLPFSDFLTWQIAGDLLPNATQEQIIATAFNRLPVQSNESGSDPEEFRWAQVFDRVNTFGSAVLGLTLECARCHDHKYDPFTMRDYYGLAAHFDKIDELGLFSRYTNGIPAPTALVYHGDEHARHEELKKTVQLAEEQAGQAREGLEERFALWLEDNAPPGQGEGLLGEVCGAERPSRPEASERMPELYISFDAIDVAKKSFIADSDMNMEVQGAPTFSRDTFGVVGRALGFDAEKPKKVGFPKVGHYQKWMPFSFSFWFKTEQQQEHAVILHRSRAGLDAANRGYEITFEDGRLTMTLANFYPGNAIRIQARHPVDFTRWRHIGSTYDGSGRAAGMTLYVDGNRLETEVIRDHLYRDIDYLVEWGDLDNAKVADADAAKGIMLMLGGRTLDAGLRDAAIDELRAYDACLSGPEMAKLAGLDKPLQDRDWLEWFAREVDAPCREADQRLRQARDAENSFVTKLGEIMVMKDAPVCNRRTRILDRGDFRHPKEEVDPGVPEVLGEFPKEAPRNRLGLARWVTATDNPLTSRVAVNRLWKMFFGKGLVTTAEDFGLKGAPPTHPLLLDWLAIRFMESGWDVKALCREIALCRTFRQSSLPGDEESRRRDPLNEQLARWSGVRLSAEQLRDSALLASGLLNPALGGPSVKPYQPAGLWEDSGTQHVYEQDKGEKLYRRSLYTFWRRTCPPPMMSIFDAPTREFCRVRRETTTTPLQALALQNDTGMLECVRVLAEDMVSAFNGTGTDEARLKALFSRMAGRDASPGQLEALTKLLAETRSHYLSQPEDAAKLLAASGEKPRNGSLPATEVAATLLVARAVMNSDPFLFIW